MLRKYVFGARFYVSDMFKCGPCGYATRIRVLGDTCTCPRCGACDPGVCMARRFTGESCLHFVLLDDTIPC